MIQKLAQAWGSHARILFRPKEFSPQQMMDLAQRVPPAFNALSQPVDIFLRCDTMGTSFATIIANNADHFLPAGNAESALRKAVHYLNKRDSGTP